ncbi:MAG TPA: LysR family transcriptional regulator [Trebonia sp.]|jgi:DNA-binding transcriptional LysR family regulator
MLDLRRLSVLVTVAEEGSFTAAAERLYMTQSAVSQQMALLERDAGIDLFHRLPRGVELTAAGKLLTSRARALLTESLAVEQELHRLAHGGREVRLAAFVSAGVELLPQTFRAFMVRCPGSQLVVRDTSGEALSLLAQGAVDAVLMWDYDFEPLPPDHRFARIHLAEDPMMAVLPAGHRLAGERQVRLAELAADKWVTRAHRALYGQEPYEKMFRIAGFEPDIVFRAADYQILQGMVATGLGVSMAPRMSLSPHRADVVVLPLTEPAISRAVTVWTLPQTAEVSPVAELIEALREAATELTQAPRGLPDQDSAGQS